MSHTSQTLKSPSYLPGFVIAQLKSLHTNKTQTSKKEYLNCFICLIFSDLGVNMTTAVYTRQACTFRPSAITVDVIDKKSNQESTEDVITHMEPCKL